MGPVQGLFTLLPWADLTPYPLCLKDIPKGYLRLLRHGMGFLVTVVNSSSCLLMSQGASPLGDFGMGVLNTLLYGSVFVSVCIDAYVFIYVFACCCCFFLIGIHSMQGWTGMDLQEKKAHKRLQDKENLFRKNLQLKDNC